MLIKYENDRGHHEKSIENYIIEKLNGQDCENGELEDIKSTLENCHYFIAALVELLATKKVISIDEIKQLTAQFYI